MRASEMHRLNGMNDMEHRERYWGVFRFYTSRLTQMGGKGLFVKSVLYHTHRNTVGTKITKIHSEEHDHEH